jgi:hypothetical protein
VFFLFLILLSGCLNKLQENNEIIGQAILVDNFRDKQPLEHAYIEIEYTSNDGIDPEVIYSTSSNEEGYFEIEAEYQSEYLNIDSWTVAKVYSDQSKTDTLGSFSFQFAEDTYSYKTIYLDTFCLAHQVWLIPRITDLNGCLADEITIEFNNCDPIEPSIKIVSYPNPFNEDQTFPPVEIDMNMNLQHWLRYGSKELAWCRLKLNTQEVGYGYFVLENPYHTKEGDSIYLDFRLID